MLVNVTFQHTKVVSKLLVLAAPSKVFWGLANRASVKAARIFISFLYHAASVLWLCAASVQAEVQSIRISGEVSIFDGDTLEIGPVLLRLHGIDAPENGQKCTTRDGGAWRCGAAASARMANFISGKALDCNPLDRDPYGRIIARCTADGVDLGALMVREGLAWAFLEYSMDYAEMETAARDAGLNVWQAETQTPWDYRNDKWNRAVEARPDGCPIKGNIGAGKVKIYHTPWSPNYGTTKIDETKDEVWFCTEAEALAAGWVAQRSK